MRVLPAVIIGIAVLVAAVVIVFLPVLLREEEGFAGPAIDSGARIEIEMLNQQIDDLREAVDSLSSDVAEMSNELSRVASRPMQPSTPMFQAPTDNQPFQQSGPNDIIDAYAQVVLIANRENVNEGLEIAGSRWLGSTFGLPREDLDQTCREMTNQRLASKLRLADVGPIRVRMLQPAIDSLTRVFEKVRATDPDLYARISTAGSLCVRAIRGTTNRASTHSYGLAVDLNIDGKLDTLGDGKTQLGLTILADFFREEGWVWGASWRREDSMHFEVSRQKLEEWIRDGQL